MRYHASTRFFYVTKMVFIEDSSTFLSFWCVDVGGLLF